MTYTRNSHRFSFEFFPPKTEAGAEKLQTVRQELATLQPDFFSVTYGAGGSTRERTKGIVLDIQSAGLAVAPHLSFGGDDEATLLQLINEYKEAGIKRIVALRGDAPSGMGGAAQLVYANELVAFIREHTGDYFHLEVAAYPEIHPQAMYYDKDIHYLKGKFDAGADSAITQYFYNTDGYFYFLENCRKQGIEQPIVPGIMPITNFSNLSRFSDACGAEIPRWIRKRLEGYSDDQESIVQFGIEFVSQMCERLLQGGAPGLHFYTMNQAHPTTAIWNNLGISEQ